MKSIAKFIFIFNHALYVVHYSLHFQPQHWRLVAFKIVDPRAERKVVQSHQVDQAYKSVISHVDVIYEHWICSIASVCQ